MLSWKVGLVVIIATLCILPFQSLSIKLSLKRRNELKEVDYDKNTAIIDGITNFETVSLYGEGKRERNLLSAIMQKWSKASINFQNTFRVIDFFARTGGILVFSAGAFAIAQQYNLGLISIGAVVVIINFLMKISGNVMDLVFAFRGVFKDMPILEDVCELLNEKSIMEYPEIPVMIKQVKGRIEFKNVSFGYNSKIETLHNINLDVKPGQTVAFVGPSGGGKTTAARLLLRYFDVNSGSICIDGVNIKDMSKENLNSLFGVVPQEPILFNRSIKYNIGYALSEGLDVPINEFSKVLDASKEAQIHDFILTLPDGYNTVVGERGIKLSGGQKQRVAIARVILKNPKIIIFDEATSMLDSESEKAIQKAFKELSKDTTTIIIAHRLSTITHADKIVVLDKGKIVEQGTHEDLLKLKGVYANLWKIQSGGFIKSKN